jgi:protein-L-isoaspartate(D-aspartate) O-methyltransferase
MTVHAPIPDFEAARRAMVDSQLRPEGVIDRAVIQAMGAIPRELFVPEELRPIAYSDRSIVLGYGRYLSPPSVLGQLLTQMIPVRGERALVVGAGTGYAAAVLKHMGVETVALESQPELTARARELGVDAVEGPLDGGYKKGAPYALMLIDGGIEFIPEALVEQLADGGRLGAALIERGVSRLIVGRKAGGGFGYLSVADAGVAPLPGFTRPRAFTF